MNNMITEPIQKTTELKPSYNIPLVLILSSLVIYMFQAWLGLAVGLFGIFLLVQAYTLRLNFTPDSLKIYRGEKLIRDFPYSQWEYSEIFWSRLPVLFYFREVNSIHFLPIIFDAKMLRDSLEQHPCHLKINNPSI